MRRTAPSTVRWLLCSDLHFKHRDLNRVRQTAQWIVAEAERNRVGRVVVCGDLLTSRTMQQTHVLSACYRFISALSDAVPHVHILLGNHDLAYRRDYQTTALDALNIRRLAPFVSLHSSVAHDEWDGRRVLLLPFREEQSELTEAVAALGPDEASTTVAFAHLAINKAITQRYVVGSGSDGVDNRHASNPITHRGLTGPGRFASLARTFTGHFHSHQTITQQGSSTADLHGSVTYLGAPLQLSWADLYDEQRGVVLFDPATLEHELLVNPHAVGYTTADLQQVLDGQVDERAVVDKHVMLIGRLTNLKYVTARDKLLSLGVRSVRDWTPVRYTSRASQSSLGDLGASVPASDAAVQPIEERTEDGVGSATATDVAPASDPGAEPRAERLDLAAEARNYVESLELDASLSLRRDELVRVGQRMIQASHELADDMDDDAEAKHQDFLDGSSQPAGTRTATGLQGPSAHVFVAEPRTLTITNFLGMQGTTTIDFRQDVPRGLTFLVGHNGSGKSTLVEAMVWCQFGRCVRDRLAVDDVVNDKAGKNCAVVLEFANGYSIARYRKHRMYKNRAVVALHGKPQLQLEQADAATTQEAINELLGTDYATYVRTVVLGHDSAASFLSATPAKRHDRIEASLGLSILVTCEKMARLLLKNIKADMDAVEGKREASAQRMEIHEQQFEKMHRKQKRAEHQAAEAAAALKSATQDHARREARSTETSKGMHVEHLALQNQIHAEQENVQQLQNLYARVQENLRRLESVYGGMQEQKRAEQASWPGWLQQQLDQLGQRREKMAAAHPAGLRRLSHAMAAYTLRLLLAAVRGLLRTGKAASDQDDNPQTAMNDVRRDIAASTAQLHSLEHDENLSMEHIARVNERLLQQQKQQAAMDKQRADRNNTLQRLQQQVTLSEHDAAIYKELAETEQASLRCRRAEHDALAVQRHELAANRELFVFWSSALAKRPGSKTKAAASVQAAASFREHIRAQSISELNKLLAPALAVLYDGTRHADTATGMLRALFDSESAADDAASVLGPSLAVHPSLAYSRLSSGERKRIDLALFFALLQLARARSAHRAYYVLVDEVFDNLDQVGQAAVVRWCGVMSPAVVGWIVVITHSPSLVEPDPGEDTSKALVVQATMGQGGTELSIDGRRIGR